MPGCPPAGEPLQEDWDLLLSFLPENWEALARQTGALRKLRKDKSPSKLLRTLLLHLGCGHSLRETAVRARQAQWADLSDVALLKRLRKCRDWLQALCVELLRERGWAVGLPEGQEVRAFDGTLVKEPGRSGSLWRIHYSVRLPSLTCDFFRLTGTQGAGTGESLTQFPIERGDRILADRGYSTGRGIGHVAESGGQVTVRVNTGALVLLDDDGRALDLVACMRPLSKPGVIGSERASARVDRSGGTVRGRLCALRKTEEAIRIAQRKLRKEASKKGREPRPETLELARYVILFTTVPEDEWTDSEVLEWYRTRWQVELVFKRFKSLAQLGSLPKYHPDSAKAWLYGKLLAALLVEKLISHAGSISPWGYVLGQPAP